MAISSWFFHFLKFSMRWPTMPRWTWMMITQWFLTKSSSWGFFCSSSRSTFWGRQAFSHLIKVANFKTFSSSSSVTTFITHVQMYIFFCCFVSNSVWVTFQEMLIKYSLQFFLSIHVINSSFSGWKFEMSGYYRRDPFLSAAGQTLPRSFSEGKEKYGNRSARNPNRKCKRYGHWHSYWGISSGRNRYWIPKSFQICQMEGILGMIWG